MQLARLAIGQLLLKPRRQGAASSLAIAVRSRSPKPRFVYHRAASFWPSLLLALRLLERKSVHKDHWQLGEKCEFGT